MINVEYELPEYNGELNEELLKYFSEDSTKLLMAFYYKYTNLDNAKLKIFTDNNLIEFSFLVLPKLLNIGRIKTSDYLLEDGTYVSCVYGPKLKFDIKARREFIFFNLKKYFSINKVNQILDRLQKDTNLDKRKIEESYNLFKYSNWDIILKAIKDKNLN